jgi:hypothetical protein
MCMPWNKQLLNCHCGWSRGGGGRTKEPVNGELVPVFGKTTVISLPHACLAAGLLDDVQAKSPVNWSILLQLAQQKWERSAERFLADAARVGVTPESVAQRARSLRGAIIGWTATDRKRTNGARERFGICADLELSTALLACRIGDIFISARAPDCSWDALFGTVFECDADLGPAPELNEAPWQQYPWKLGKSA